MKCFIVLAALVVLAQSVPFRSGKNISFTEDGTIIITDGPKRLVISRPYGLNGQKNINISVTGPNIPPRTIQIGDESVVTTGSQVGYNSDIIEDEYLRSKRSGTGKFSQGEILFDILKQFQGIVDDVRYASLLERINQFVQKGVLSNSIYEILLSLSQAPVVGVPPFTNVASLLQSGVQGGLQGVSGLWKGFGSELVQEEIQTIIQNLAVSIGYQQAQEVVEFLLVSGVKDGLTQQQILGNIQSLAGAVGVQQVVYKLLVAGIRNGLTQGQILVTIQGLATILGTQQVVEGLLTFGVRSGLPQQQIEFFVEQVLRIGGVQGGLPISQGQQIYQPIQGFSGLYPQRQVVGNVLPFWGQQGISGLYPQGQVVLPYVGQQSIWNRLGMYGQGLGGQGLYSGLGSRLTGQIGGGSILNSRLFAGLNGGVLSSGVVSPVEIEREILTTPVQQPSVWRQALLNRVYPYGYRSSGVLSPLLAPQQSQLFGGVQRGNPFLIDQGVPLVDVRGYGNWEVPLY